jgi:hypothetical protein
MSRNPTHAGKEGPVEIAQSHAAWAIELLRKEILENTPLAADGTPMIQRYPVTEVAQVATAFAAVAQAKALERIADALTSEARIRIDAECSGIVYNHH